MRTFKLLCGYIFCVFLIVMNSCQDKQTKDDLAKFKQAETLKATNIELAKKFYKFLDVVQLDSLRVLFASDAKIYYESGDPISFSDIEPLIKMFYTSFPDYNHVFEDIIANDDRVVFRISYSGTFINKFMEMNPNGTKFRYKGIQIFQFANNKITNFWAVEDELGMMTQLGMELKPNDRKK
jgi:predicted ester cyclase